MAPSQTRVNLTRQKMEIGRSDEAVRVVVKVVEGPLNRLMMQSFLNGDDNSIRRRWWFLMIVSGTPITGSLYPLPSDERGLRMRSVVILNAHQSTSKRMSEDGFSIELRGYLTTG